MRKFSSTISRPASAFSRSLSQRSALRSLSTPLLQPLHLSGARAFSSPAAESPSTQSPSDGTASAAATSTNDAPPATSSLSRYFAPQTSGFLVNHPMPPRSAPVVTSPLDDSKTVELKKFAVFSTHSGARVVNRQFFVQVNDEIMMSKLYDETTSRVYDVGETVVFDNVLLVGSRDATVVGQPIVKNARVVATVEEQTELRKVIVFKKKKRKSYRRKKEFVPKVTILRILDIEYDFEKVNEDAKSLA